MINDTALFRCPEHRSVLEWPEARCPADGRRFNLRAMPALNGKLPAFGLFDFRPDLDYIRGDRQHAEANWKIISGLAEFEEARLASLGFADLARGADIARYAGMTKKVLYGLYFERTLRNCLDYAYWRLAGRLSGKAAGPDSVASSFMGYGRAYELISAFAEPSWLGWVDGRLVRAPVIIHHLRNMVALAATLREWEATTALEVGCGSGINLLLLRQLCSPGEQTRLSGFDYAIARVLTARATVEHFGIDVQNLFLADARNIPVADGSFDVVFSQYVVEQMAGMEEKVLDEMLRVSRKGVVMFESGLYRPTFNQRLFMRHSGYSTALPEIVRQRTDVTVERLENHRRDRFFGCPNICIVLRKKR